MSKKASNIATFIIIVAFVLIVDIATKRYFALFNEGQHVFSFIPGLIDFTVVHNSGAAWGMFGNWTNLFVGIALIICALIVLILIYRGSTSDTFSIISLSLLFAGGIGNAIDRIVYGYVIDFIKVNLLDFPVFNIADIAITCGVVLLLINFLILKRPTNFAQ